MDLQKTTLHMKSFTKEFQLINKNKVVNEILNDGKYDAILDIAKKSLGNTQPTLEQISKLVDDNPFYIAEYKDLNRWGELSSVHIRSLVINENDTQEAKSTKEEINKNVTFLRNGEEYQIPSKNGIYIAWTGFIALPAIYVIDNMVRLFTDFYINGQEETVYFSFLIVLVLSTFGYLKVKNNHTRQHERYVKTQVQTRELLRLGLEKNYFSFEEAYEE